MLSEYGLTRGDRPEDASGDAVAGLVARARSGDEEAFHAIFLRYSRPVLGYLVHMLGDRGLADELAQETFVRAYRRLDTIRDESTLGTWLFGIAHNVAREAIKKKYRAERGVALGQAGAGDIEDGRPLQDSRLIGSELEQAVGQALAELNEDQRTVFALKLFHMLSYGEISRITGSSIGKLKTDLHRARLEMRRKLRLYLGELPAMKLRGGS